MITCAERSVIEKHDRSKKCLNCKLDLDSCKYLQSGHCESVNCCGKKCQVAVWKPHKAICQSTFALYKSHRQNVIMQESYANDLSAKEKAKVATLIGDKCLMDFQLDGVPSTALLDSGAQVSIVSEKHLKNELSDHQIRTTSDILDEPDSLKVQWRDNAEIPFTGYLTLPLQLGTNPDMQLGIPFLVTREQLPHPIIGFNVVKVIADSH